jgi:hypothetical protein
MEDMGSCGAPSGFGMNLLPLEDSPAAINEATAAG